MVAHDTHRRFGVAVIGCGGMGRNHLAAASGSPRARLMAAVDVIPDVAERAAADFKAEHALTDYRQALERDDVDVVVIATWPSSHCELTCAALRAGKHVLLEKPLAPTLEQAEEIVRVAVETRRKLRVGYILRFNESYIRIADRIHAGAIGSPMILRMMGGEHTATPIHWQRDLKLIVETSPAIDCGCHYVDVMRWFTGAEAVSISGLGCRTEPEVPAGNFDYEIYTVQLSDGSAGVYEVGWTHQYRNFSEKEFMGPKGRIRLTYARERVTGQDRGDLIEYYAFPSRHEFIDVGGRLKRVEAELHDLFDYVEQDKDPVPGLIDALKSLPIVLAGHQAALTRQSLLVPARYGPVFQQELRGLARG